MDIYRKNHDQESKFENITEASNAFKEWFDFKMEHSREREHNYKFVFRGFSKVIRDKKLNASEISLYFAILEEIERTTGICTKPNAYFKNHLDMPQRTLDEALKGLEKKGLIHRELGYDEDSRMIRAICVLPY